MPQIFNDESIVPALMARGISAEDARNYAIVGCVELTTHGNALGWSDAAMFNMVKALELTLNNGVCLLTGKKMGLDLGSLVDYRSYEELETAFRAQIDHFIGRMIKACDVVDRLHAEILPSPLLSSVIKGCAEKGLDVTAGGACYNLSGIQAIQPANLADCLAAIKQCVFDERSVSAEEALAAMRSDYAGQREAAAVPHQQGPEIRQRRGLGGRHRGQVGRLFRGANGRVHERPRRALSHGALHGVRPRAHGPERRRLSGRAQGQGPSRGWRHVRDVRPRPSRPDGASGWNCSFR